MQDLSVIYAESRQSLGFFIELKFLKAIFSSYLSEQAQKCKVAT